MNKCPKCGSEMIHRPSLFVYSCTNGKCYHNIDAGSVLLDVKSDYEKRLDKVLSKFYKVIDGNIFALRFDIKTEVLDNAKTEVYLYTETNGKLILEMVDVYVDEEWLMTTEIEHSLDTVESLLKDLEGVKNE